MIDIPSMRSLHKEWRKRVAGDIIVDYRRGVGFYFQFWRPQKGTITTMSMRSGKTMRVKLLDYRMFSDPNDMTEWSMWQYIGYLGEKLYSDMTFEEYYLARTGKKLQRARGIMGWIESKIYR